MNVFVTINNFTKCYQFSEGDNVDRFILKAYIRYFENNNNNIMDNMKEGYNNFFERSIYKLDNKSFRFGDKYILTHINNEGTVYVKFLGGESKNFTKRDIKYIESLF